MTLRSTLTERLAAAFQSVVGEPVDPMVHSSQVADFQADAAMRVARAVGRKPRDLATDVVAAAQLQDLCKNADVAGPGFINLTVADSAISRDLLRLSADERLGVSEHSPSVVVIDYSAPNIAKEMHVGHLRSTIIGDASARLLEWMGYTVVRQNHVGDWGTPFGMLIEYASETGGYDPDAVVEDIDAMYKRSRLRFDEDAAFRERARSRVVLLQAGDEDTLKIWRCLVDVSRRYFDRVYEQLDVTLTDEDIVGESSYNEELEPTIAELEAKGLLEESDGALCAFVEGYTARDGSQLPLIVRKSDGGYGYAATDLAAIRRRVRVLGARRLLYVVGLPQSQHLAMVFEVARWAGWLESAVAEHIGFGSILGPDGKMLRSRAGVSIRLSELLNEAVDRASDLIAARGSRLSGAENATLAHQLGVGAVKYADLSTDRTKDYVFDLTRMLALDGDTAPYLQYAHARIESILRNHAGVLETPDAVKFEKPIERDLTLRIAQFGDVIEDVAKSLEFHRLTTYLFGLATAFSSFYEQCPVLRAPVDLRMSRLQVCHVTARVLKRGLSVLGIEAPARV